MKTTHILLTATLILAAATALAGDPSPDEMMKAYLEAAKPGAPHERLAEKAGTWHCTMRSWMDPAGEPMVSHGTEEARMILGGRYLETAYSGEMMGMPFEGRGVMGYDNGKQKYVGTWYDSMGTGIMSYEGDYDATQDALVCHGEYVDPVTGQTQHTKLVTRELGPDRHVFEMTRPSRRGGPRSSRVRTGATPPRRRAPAPGCRRRSPGSARPGRPAARTRRGGLPSTRAPASCRRARSC